MAANHLRTGARASFGDVKMSVMAPLTRVGSGGSYSKWGTFLAPLSPCVLVTHLATSAVARSLLSRGLLNVQRS